MKNRLNILIIVLLTSLLLACGSHGKQKKNEMQRYVVKTEAMHKTLYFTGTIQPLHESTVTSPMDAVIETMHYHYGQLVHKGDVLVTLNSNELQKQYNDTLTDYLKAKDSFTVAQARFTGTQELWNAGLLSKNNYLSEQSSLGTARVSLMQATRKLSEMLEKVDGDFTQNLSALSIAEFDKVRQALNVKHNLIPLKAPASGVLLYPPKSGDEKTGRLNVGSTLKTGQVIALVGDLTGISVEIDVPEIDIDKIHPGMSATITGVALGKQVLQGKLVVVNAQASNTVGGALPSFTAIVEVKTLSQAQRPWIRVGMSASIALTLDGDEQLLIPIAAVKQEKGKSVVKLQTANGSLRTSTVSTGAAQADKVVVTSGLKVGDVVAYDG